jgi:hypothetical protein
MFYNYVPLTVLYAFVVFWCNKHYSISLHYTHNIVQLYSFHIKLNSKHFFYQYNKYIKTNWRISLSQIMKYVTHDQIMKYVTHDQIMKYVTHDQIMKYVTHDQIMKYVTHSVCAFVSYCVIWSFLTYFL